MRTYNVVIEGVAPGLLMHKFSAQAETELLSNTRKTNPKSETPAEAAEQVAYRDTEGKLCQPAEHIYAALCKAASEFKIRGRGKKTYKDPVKGNVMVWPEFIPHQVQNYVVDSRPVRIQRARVMRHRPLLPEWRLRFTLQVLDSGAVPTETLQAILARAGETIGIGDYRPRFGRFRVVSFEPA